ncbi:hypothetical protein CUMW_180030 [Citrus unshiu]|nr:hypothetical protein CUMW_180030 [Citrus unshiu]
MRGRSYTPSPPPRGSGGGYGRRGRSPSPRGRYGGGRGRDLPTSLLVRNLRHDCRPEDIRRPFEQFGAIKDIYLPRDYYSGGRFRRRSPPPRYSRSPPPRYARSPSYGRDYSPPPRRRNYSRSVSPHGQNYSRERSYSRSPAYDGPRGRSRSPHRGQRQSWSPSRSRTPKRNHSVSRSRSRSPRREYSGERNGDRPPSQ